jgi:hypothetical protein
MGFTTLNLSGERVLVRGTDSQGTNGETVLDASEWNAVKARTQLASAHEDFDRVVEEFFAPITEALDKLHLEHDRTEQDEMSFIVLDEGEEATAGRRRSVITLSKDSIVLRLIEGGHSDRLVWVHDELEVLEVLPGTAGVEATNGTSDEVDVPTVADDHAGYAG